MYYGIGAMLSEMAYESSNDEESRALWSTVHTVLSLASLAQTARIANVSTKRTAYHLGNVLPGLAKVREATRSARPAA